MIIICKICKQYVCPASCPEFLGYVAGLESASGECEICSSRVYEGDGHHYVNGKSLCSECAEEIVSRDLLDLLECADIKEFFDLLH